MPCVELLVIEAAFQINNRIILVPDFSVPEGWTNRKETVVVATPDERQFETLADFNMAHFQIGDPVASIEISAGGSSSPFRKDERTTSPSAAGSLFPPTLCHAGAWRRRLTTQQKSFWTGFLITSPGGPPFTRIWQALGATSGTRPSGPAPEAGSPPVSSFVYQAASPVAPPRCLQFSDRQSSTARCARRFPMMYSQTTKKSTSTACPSELHND